MSVASKILSWFNRVRLPEPGPRTSQVPLLRAGVRVDHDVAMTYSAVYAAVRVISETIASLPWGVYRQDQSGGREHLISHPTTVALSRRPNAETTPFTFKSNLIAHALTWGNGYAEIERDSIGRVKNLWLLTPDMVEVKRDLNTGEKYYVVYQARGPAVELRDNDVFHLQGLGFDGVVGYSVVSLMAKSVGLGLAAEDFGSALFANGALPNSVLKHPSRLSQEAFDRLKEDIKVNHTGSSNAHRTMILEENMEWQTIGIPPEDAQFLETRKFQVSEIARWFRVPPHKLGDLERATFSNIEHQSKEFVTDSLMPWIARLEQEANLKLLRAGGTSLYTKINVNGLLRGDSAARATFYKEMAALGVFSVNDIRELEDLDPIGPEGDKRLVQMNLTTLEKVGEEPEPAPAPEPEPVPATEPEENNIIDWRDINRPRAKFEWSINDNLAEELKSVQDSKQDED